METETETHEYLAACFYRQLSFDNPVLAGQLGADTEFGQYHSEHSIPSTVVAPKSYVARVYAAYTAISNIENNNPCYAALDDSTKAKYDEIWSSIYDILPNYVKKAIDDGEYKQCDWNVVTADSLFESINKAIEREADNSKHRH